MHDFSFPATERLKSRKTISSLFQKEKSKSFAVYPIRLVWVDLPFAASAKVQSAFSVPKRSFRKATRRNTIRRRMREAYRLHKHLLYSGETSKSYGFMWIYTSREEMPYSTIERCVRSAIEKWLIESQRDK